MQDDPKLLNVEQFSTALGITMACTRRWILERRIAIVKVGRLVRIPHSELTRLVEDGFRPARERDHARVS